jgi:hypothetical protein
MRHVCRPRFEHYQTTTHVTVVLWIKGANADSCTITTSEGHRLEASVKLPSGAEFALDLDLYAK